MLTAKKFLDSTQIISLARVHGKIIAWETVKSFSGKEGCYPMGNGSAAWYSKLKNKTALAPVGGPLAASLEGSSLQDF
jgi:hypothetical protein